MLELGSSGSVRGALSNEHPYRDPRSVLVVVVVIGVISVAAMIVPVIGHRISNCCAPNPTHDRADRTANNSTGDGAPNPSCDRATFVGKGNLR
jgi:hypothetical protein